jgi:uncharacterized membrane protein YraQ (UPF0718 family)
MPDWEKISKKLKRIFLGLNIDQPQSGKLIVNDSIVIAECCVCTEGCILRTESVQTTCCGTDTSCCAENNIVLPFKKRLLNETWRAFFMTSKFMALAFIINALIIFCLPADLFNNVLANNGPFAIVLAALVGIPVYTSNMTALPMVSGLLAVGMNPGAALAFLIAGPVSTLPAMSAVWGLVSRKVFLLYLVFPFVGAILFGWLYTVFQ